MYITIEGPIGVGKSSLTKLISKEMKYNTLFEIVEENPFLERFYEDTDKYAFQTEMFFLTNRYTQLKEVKEKYLDNDLPVVSDYNIKKNMLFADNTLKGSDRELFSDIFSNITDSLATSDLTIFLRASVDTLKIRIAKRGREFEDKISDDYLQTLIDAYDKYIQQELENSPNFTLVFDCDELDFVNNQTNKEYILNQINSKINLLKENNE